MKVKKVKLIPIIIAVVLCMAAFSVTTFAAEFTPKGNLTLVDNFTELPETVGKQFITLQSKNGNYFYLVIDRDGNSDNVYFMNLIDEADLLALMEEGEAETEPSICRCKDKCALGTINGSCEVCRVDMDECIGTEIVIEPSDTNEHKGSGINSTVVIAAVLAVAIVAGVGVYLFKLRTPKAGKSDPDLDDYDFGDDDDTDETEINESEETDDAEPIDDDTDTDTDEDGENE